MRAALKKQQEEQSAAAKPNKTQSSASNEFIKNILQSNTLATSSLLPGASSSNSGSAARESETVTHTLSELKLSTFVVECEILPKPKIVTYEREVQCDLYEEGIVAKPSVFEEYHEDDPGFLPSMDRSVKASALGLVSTSTSFPAPSSGLDGDDERVPLSEINDEDGVFAKKDSHF